MLQKHKKNYPRYLLELQATVWGMGHNADYLKGQPFTLFIDHQPVGKLGKVHTKTLHQLQEVMHADDFMIKLRQDNDLPANFSSNAVIQAISWEPKQLQVALEADLIIGHLKCFSANRSCLMMTFSYSIPSGFPKMDSFIEDSLIRRWIK